jgi:hypothetical protein
MSSKNPFEIRTEVLAMAKEYLDKQLQLQLEYTKKMMEAGEKIAEDIPTMYTTDELISKAQELYGFVSKKD